MTSSRSSVNHLAKDIVEEIIERAFSEIRMDLENLFDTSSSPLTDLSSLSPSSSTIVTGGPFNDVVLSAMVVSSPESVVETVVQGSETVCTSPVSHLGNIGNGKLEPRRLYNNDCPDEYGGQKI